MPAIKADLSTFIALVGLIPAYIERFRRKREEMLLILFKELRYRSAFFIVGFGCLLCMLVKKAAVEFFDVVVCGNRNNRSFAGLYLLYSQRCLSRIRHADCRTGYGTRNGHETGQTARSHVLSMTLRPTPVALSAQEAGTPDVVENILKPWQTHSAVSP